MSTRLRTLGVLLLASTVFSCSKKAPEPASAVVTAPAVAKASAAGSATDGAGAGTLDPKDPKHGTRKLMGLDTPVFVDGVQSAVLRAGEMPSIPAITLEGGARRFRVADYLAAIGVAPASVKSIHFHGNGDRVASVEGPELRKDKERFVFGFTSNTTGAPLQNWDTEGLANEYVANEIRRVTVYVAKAPPAIHPQQRCHLDDKGACSDAIPYQSGEIAKGTRVYVDGKMVGFVKRRQIGDALAMGDTATGEHKFSVSKLVDQMGGAGAVSHVELLAGDDVIARASGDEWKKLASETYFTLPKHNHGKVRVHVPAAIQSKEEASADRDAMVSAVLVYRSTKPADRPLTAISEQTDMSVQLASMDDARERLGRGER